MSVQQTKTTYRWFCCKAIDMWFWSAELTYFIYAGVRLNEGENKLPKNHSKLNGNLKYTFEIGKKQLLLLHIHPMKSLLSSFDKI